MTDPVPHLFWLASRAVGIVALALLAGSVALGLAMSGRLSRRPGWPARLRRMHEATALVTVGAIGVHGLLLLGDGYLRPGLGGVLLPFASAYRPAWTGLGVLAGWLGLLLAASFYVRRWIGGRTWRALHRWTLAVYVLALAHTIGAGSDAGATWFQAALAVQTAPIVFGLALRALPPAPRARAAARSPG